MQDIPGVHELMESIGFDGADLDANRAGQLGENQQTRLQQMQRRAVLVGGLGFLVVGLLATVFLYFAQRNDSLILMGLGIVLTILNAGIVGLFGQQWMKLSVDLRDGQVRVISGEMERVVKANGKMNNFVLRVNGEDFHVSKDLFKCFRHEIPYHLYCTPHSRVLLAAEPAQ